MIRMIEIAERRVALKNWLAINVQHGWIMVGMIARRDEKKREKKN